MFDILIRGGSLIDGTGAPGATGDIGIAEGKIVAVGNRLSDTAGEVIDADGPTVTPGFIDTHAHHMLAAFDKAVSTGVLIRPAVSQHQIGLLLAIARGPSGPS